MTNDIFDSRSASPMLLTESEPFDSKDHIFELKLDGIRCLAYLDSNMTELRNKRNKILNATYPELNKIHERINKKCILDGELVVITNGKPDFFEVQKRSLMTDQFKIELASKQRPVRFVAYDMIYLENKSLINTTLIERKRLLEETVDEDETLAVSRYIHEQGINFYQLVAKQDLEGIVAKKKDSYYYFGKRSKDWVKFKKMYDAEFIILGYIPDEEGKIKSLALGAYRNGLLVSQGHVALGISSEEAKIIMIFAAQNRQLNPFDYEDKYNTIWFKAELVCTVEFMMRTETGFLRQPVYKGLRTDKEPEECII